MKVIPELAIGLMLFGSAAPAITCVPTVTASAKSHHHKKHKLHYRSILHYGGWKHVSKMKINKILASDINVNLKHYRIISCNKSVGGEWHILINPHLFSKRAYLVVGNHKGKLKDGQRINVKGTVENAGKLHDDLVEATRDGQRVLYVTSKRITRSK